VDEQDLERRATLAVEGQGAEHALADRQLEVGVGKHDRRVLGLEAEHAAQAVGPRVGLLERVRRSAGADEGEHVDQA
jgi:hypothetical protein